MKLFNKEKKKENLENIAHKDEAMQGIQTLLENGFLVEKEGVDEGVLYDGTISVRSELFAFTEKTIEGDDDENLKTLYTYLKQYIIKEGFVLGRQGQLDFPPKAILDMVAFVMGNRDFDANEPVFVDVVRTGIEIKTKAALPEKRTSTYAEYLMENSLQDAIKACIENDNGYPLVTYDTETGEIAVAVWIAPIFVGNRESDGEIQIAKEARVKASRPKKIKYL